MHMKRIIKLSTSILLLTLLFSSVVFAQDEQRTHVVQPGEGLYGISVLYGVTVDELETWNNITDGVIHPGDELIVSPPTGDTRTEQSEDVDGNENAGNEVDETDSEADKTTEDSEEVTEDNYIPTIVQHSYPPEVHVHFQNILNQFSDFPTLIQVDMLDEESQYARINKDLSFNNTPIGRVIVLAYTLNKVERGGVNWDQEFEYTEEIESVKSNYPVNMTGVSESTFTNGSFTLRELVQGTLENDMNAFYLLLHHVGFENVEDLNLFISNTTGGQFTLDISTDDVHEYMRYIHNHNDQTIQEIWAASDATDSLIGSDDNTFMQLTGENENIQYLSGVISGDKSYVITIITERLDTHESDGIAMRINDNRNIKVDPRTYAFNNLLEQAELKSAMHMLYHTPALAYLLDRDDAFKTIPMFATSQLK